MGSSPFPILCLLATRKRLPAHGRARGGDGTRPFSRHLLLQSMPLIVGNTELIGTFAYNTTHQSYTTLLRLHCRSPFAKQKSSTWCTAAPRERGSIASSTSQRTNKTPPEIRHEPRKKVKAKKHCAATQNVNALLMQPVVGRDSSVIEEIFRLRHQGGKRYVPE